ncbi:MAG: ribonuclease Y [Candidatus Moranbacteria bacterium]|nr:ribonuclease Y [Candidatus Moranbacteria bacterium]
MSTTLVFVVALVLGIVSYHFVSNYILKSKEKRSKSKADKLVSDANLKAKDIILEAKDKAVKALSEIKKEEEIRRSQLNKTEERLSRMEGQVEKKEKQTNKRKKDIEEKIKQVKEIKEKLSQIRKSQIAKLEKIAKLNQEQAKKLMLDLIEEENKEMILKKIQKIEEKNKEKLEKKAVNLMTMAMQRYASSHVSDTTTTTVNLPDDELKGRIIGREGRNINSIERLTGAEIIVDDTPEAIIVSAFDPVRREVAKLTLQKLIQDGRIHPAKIEETVNSVKREIAKKVKEAGEAAVYDVGITGLDEKLVQLIGRLRFRTSYGQNVLIHAIEVAHLSGMLAQELGLDPTLCKKAGLLHDIGKVVDHEVEGTHIDIGINILKKFNISEEVIEAMKHHHDDLPCEKPEAAVIAAADAISASRPGARKDTLENYLKRLKELEDLAGNFEEVEKCYAIQAGREIRIFVNPEVIDDLKANKLARKIAEKIEDELKYPGEVKVNLIRETRSIEYAR